MNTFETKLSEVIAMLCWNDEQAESVGRMLRDEEYTERDIRDYVDWCNKRFHQGLDTEFDSWLEYRLPRVDIEIFVTEDGHPIHEKLEFPKRGEDLEHGTEFEWYYSLCAVKDQIMALKPGESLYFKIRDDKSSHGVILRTK